MGQLLFFFLCIFSTFFSYVGCTLVILLSLKTINYIKSATNVKKRQLKPLNGLIKKFSNTYKFCNGDINKFILFLRKVVYPHQHMDSWERFDETSLPDKKPFYNELNLEDITDKGYTHAQKVFEEFILKNLGDYHDLYVQGDTVLLADVFENFRNKFIEIYELDPAHFLSALELALEAC